MNLLRCQFCFFARSNRNRRNLHRSCNFSYRNICYFRRSFHRNFGNYSWRISKYLIYGCYCIAFSTCSRSNINIHSFFWNNRCKHSCICWNHHWLRFSSWSWNHHLWCHNCRIRIYHYLSWSLYHHWLRFSSWSWNHHLWCRNRCCNHRLCFRSGYHLWCRIRIYHYLSWSLHHHWLRFSSWSWNHHLWCHNCRIRIYHYLSWSLYHHWLRFSSWSWNHHLWCCNRCGNLSWC